MNPEWGRVWVGAQVRERFPGGSVLLLALIRPATSLGNVLYRESHAVARAASTGRAGGDSRACSSINASHGIRFCHMRVLR